MSRVYIGQWQLVAILACLLMGKSIGVTSGAIIRLVNNDALLAMIIAYGASFLFILPVVWLARRFPTEQPRQYVPRVLGRPLGALALILLGIFFLGSFISSAITVELHINDFLMTETPTLVFVTLYSLLCLYAAYLGVETAARLAIFGVFMNIALGLLMVVGSTDHFQFDRFFPILDHPIDKVLAGSGIALTDAGMVIAGALVLLPLAGQPKRWTKLTAWGLFIGALTVLVWPLFEIGALGPEVAGHYLVSCMQMARSAELSIFLHRYELLMMLTFGWGALTQAIVTFYAGSEMLGALLPFKLSRGWFLTICAMVQLPLHYWAIIDRERFDVILHHIWPFLAVPIALGVPLLIWLVSLLRSAITPTATSAR